MLTGKLVRVRFARDRIIPYYIDEDDPVLLETAERLCELFRSMKGLPHGELDDEVYAAFGDDPTQLVLQGMVKLLEDRCEFETVSGHPPEELREAVFLAAGKNRAEFDRTAILEQVGQTLNLTGDQVDGGLFADLKTEQRLIEFQDISAEHLLQRYNVALAQAVLLRSVKVTVAVRNESVQRYRRLFRRLKFHRLIVEVKRTTPDSYMLSLDGPLSLFSATQKYGLQLAVFLPELLLCKDFELEASLRWGPQRKEKTFVLSSSDRLVSHLPDYASYVPQELSMFVELFRKRIDDWEIVEESEIFPLGGGFWVPDFRLKHTESGKIVLLEVLGFWRKAGAEQHLQRLKAERPEPFLLAISDQLHICEEELDGLPAEIYRFRQMPLPDEVARLAREILGKI